LEVRLARLLLSMVRKQDDDKSGKRRLESRLSQGELALLIGATRPRVNDALALLEAQGAIERDGSTLICNLAALATIGETDES
jgi:CRP-like cAMP-binding protein